MPQNNDALIYVFIFATIMLFFVIAVIYIAFLGSNPKKQTKVAEVKTNSKDKEIKNLNINELNAIASDSASSKNDLFNIVRYYIKNLTIPAKVDGKIPPESDPYLLFVYLIASHRNSDAKLIAYMSVSMCEKFPQYAIEIETQEKKAVNFRSMK